jgi:hypothetical protein
MSINQVEQRIMLSPHAMSACWPINLQWTSKHTSHWLRILLHRSRVNADYTTIGLKNPRAWLWCGSKLQIPTSCKSNDADCSKGMSGAVVKMETKGLPVAWVLPVGDKSQRLFVAIVTQSVQAACVVLVLTATFWAQ